MKAERILSVVVTLILMSATFSLMASPPPPPGGTSGPIDSGVLTLLIGAATYGYKKLKEREITNSDNE